MVRLEPDIAQAVVDLLDDLGIGVVVADAGRIVEVTPTLCAMSAAERADAIGTDIVSWLHVEDRAVAGVVANAGALKTRPGGDMQLVRPDGTRVPVRVAVRPRDGALPTVALVADRTEEQAAEELLGQFTELVHRIPAGVLLWDAAGVTDGRDLRVRFANEAAVAMLGAGDEIVGCRLGALMPAIDGNGASRVLALRGTRRAEHFGELAAASPDGSPVLYRWMGFGLSGDLVALRLEDITAERAEERRRLELLRRLVDAGDAERRRLAMEVHDDAIQHFTAANVLIEGLARHEPPAPDTAERLGVAVAAVRAGVDNLRRLVFELAPPELVESGLQSAVRSAAEYLLGGSGVEVTVDVEMWREPPETVQTAAFRIVAEALANVRKHARARRVEIQVRGSERDLVLTVIDDGVGIRAPAAPGHYGLRSITERAAALGGDCAVGGGYGGRGTAVSAVLPFDGLPAVAEDLSVWMEPPALPGEIESLRQEVTSLAAAAAAARDRAAAAERRLLDAMEIAKVLTASALPETGVAQAAARAIGRVLDAGVGILCLTPDAEWLEPGGVWHDDAEQLASLARHRFVRRPAAQGHEGVALRSGVPISIDHRVTPWLPEDGPEPPPGPRGRRASVVAPIRLTGSPIGVLVVVRDEESEPFSLEDVAFIDCVAVQVASAMLHAPAR